MKSTKKIKIDQIVQTVAINTRTSSYVAQASDVLKLIEMNVATPNTITINANVFQANEQLLASQYGAGETSFVAGPGMTILNSKLKFFERYSVVTLIFRSPTEAYLTGNLKV